jgi:hypothetical protein
MRELAKKVRIGSLLRLAALATAATSLGGCATLYDDYYGDSYYDDYAYSDYSCDPYNQFDYYYDCDNRSGFFNIGFGGGWYNNFFYPGYGFYLFDRGGRRFDMDNYYRRYWGGQRHEYWRQYRGNHQNGNHNRQGYGRSGNGGHLGQIGWPEQNGGRVQNGENRRRDGHHGDGRGYGNGQRDGNGQQNGQYGGNYGGNNGNADGRGYGRGRRNQTQQSAPVVGNDPQQAAQAPQPFRHPRNGNADNNNSEQRSRGGGRRGGDGEGRGGGRWGGGRSGYQPGSDGTNLAPAPAQRPMAQAAQQNAQPSPQPRAERRSSPEERAQVQHGFGRKRSERSGEE